MVIANRPEIFEKLTFKLQEVLFAESQVYPSIFVSFVVLKELELLEFPESTTCLFFLGLGYLALTFINSYFTYTASLTLTLGSFLPYNIMMGILGINQKWKLSLFSFLLVYYFPTENFQYQNALICLCSGSICFSIYRELYFPTPSNNKWFFTIFFTLFFVNCYCYVLEYVIQLETISILKIIIVPTLTFLGHTVISIHLEQILSDNILSTKNPQILIQRIQKFKESIEKDQKSIKWKIFSHKQKCNKVECFCGQIGEIPSSETDNESLKNLTKEFINQLFLESMEKYMKDNDDKVYLIHKYIEFLIDCEQYIKAISILSHTNKIYMGYFNKCDNFRIKQKLKNAYQSYAYFDDEDSRMTHFYDYDLKVGYVIKEIREIIMDKILFWVELCKESSELKTLENSGRNLVKRIENLHKYFTYKVKPTEEILLSFKCTFIYANYLLLTTNYIEYANSLTKTYQKILQEKETLKGIEQQFCLFLKIVENKEQKHNHEYELQIKNICKSLTIHLNKEKYELINSNLTEIIPNEFSKIHSESFNKFVNQNNFQIKKSTFLNTNLELPFKINHHYISFLYASSSLTFDPLQNCLNIHTILKKESHHSINFVVNLEGKLIYRENELFKDFVNEPIVKSTLSNIKSQYESHNSLDKFTVKSQVNDHLLTITFEPLFCEKLSNPLIKIVAESDVFKNEKNRSENYENTNKIKELQNPAISQQENDSQSSNLSRKDSIESVLTVLSETNSLKVEPFLALVLLLFAIIVTICIYILNDNFKIWHSSSYSSLPTFTFICLINMKDIFNTVISWRYDSVRKFEDEEEMQKLLKSLYNGKTVYEVSEFKFKELFETQSNIYNNYILGNNNYINIELKELFQKTIAMESKENNVTTKNITIQSIIYNFLFSIRHIETGYYFPKLILSFGYLPVFYNEIEIIILHLKDKIREQFKKKKKDNIVTFCLESFIFMLFIIPIWKFHTQNKKKYQQIYNLFLCIQSNLIVNEVHKLEIVEKEFFIYSNFDNRTESARQVTSLSGIGSEKKKEETLIPTPIAPSRPSINPNTPKHSFKSFSYLNSIKIRKRGGDLITSSTPIWSKHEFLSKYLPVTFIIIFIAILLSTFINKYSFMTRMDDQFEENYLAMDKVENMSISLLLSKIYVDDYELDAKRTFLGEDLEEWLQNYIQKYRSFSEFEFVVDATVKECSDNILMCQTKYSNVLRETFIKKSIWNAYQYKKIYLQNKSDENLHNLENSRFELIFSQLLDHNTYDDYQKFYSSFKSLENERVFFKIREKTILQIFWLFFSLFIIFSITYTIYVKEKYVKEVSLLSILNKEMLWNNKTVESFVQRLSKSLK